MSWSYFISHLWILTKPEECAKGIEAKNELIMAIEGERERHSLIVPVDDEGQTTRGDTTVYLCEDFKDKAWDVV